MKSWQESSKEILAALQLLFDSKAQRVEQRVTESFAMLIKGDLKKGRYTTDNVLVALNSLLYEKGWVEYSRIFQLARQYHTNENSVKVDDYIKYAEEGTVPITDVIYKFKTKTNLPPLEVIGLEPGR